MKSLFRGLCLAVFLTGVISLSQTSVKVKDQIEPSVSYSVITVHYRVSSDGLKTITGRRIRYVKANGEWRQTRYDPQSSGSSNESPVFAATDEGVYTKVPGHSERNFISNMADQHMQECFRSVRCLSNQLSLVRIDEIAGLKVYVLRDEVKVSGNPIEWIEKSYSPKTGYLPLRIVNHFRDGSEIGMEAQTVEFGNVPDDLNDDLKSLPVKGKN